MNLGLAGRRAIVTGGSKGLGRAIAAELLAEDAQVAICSRHEAELEATAAELRKEGGTVVALACDVTDPDQVTEFIEAAASGLAAEGGGDGGIDILVNNAGLLPPAKQIYKADLDEWQTVMDINLRAPWYLSKLVHPHMKSRGGGAIVNVSSTSGLHHDIGLGVYGISKAGVVMLTEVCAKEWARDGIRVNAIAPGIVKTQLAGSIIEYMQARNMKPNPMNMLGEPEDIAKLVRFLVSDDSRYMTGSIIRIDGGELL